ncbi:MAG TPA: transcription antitermination factor NusB [Thermoanaerobaculaceae bacterium]|nr:transcription antitermination factor NusB [Thermoanaerobaculaceae bacterium]
MRPASASADPRRRAATILARVDAQGAHAARLLADATPFEREVVLGALRWQLTLDHLLRPHLRRPLAQLDAPLRAVLRAGLYEAQRMDTPAPVAVAEAVRVAKSVAPRASGLANAVLRRASADPWPDPADESLPLSLRFSHPQWLIDRWVARFGEGATRSALAAGQRPAPLCLLAAATRGGWAEDAGVRLEPHPFVPGVEVVAAGGETVAEGLRQGRAYAMDPAAVMVARLVPDIPGVVADLAAAPGGKSLVLALERPRGTLVSADRNLGRVVLMARTLALAGARPRPLVADASAPAIRQGGCAVVLLDAPCSGTGTLRRHPEIRWRLRPADLPGLAAVQRRLARAAAALVAPGGFLLYSTCSLEAEENDAVVADLGLEPVAVEPLLPAAATRTVLAGGGVTILPSEANDGHTVHLLRAGR